MFIPNEYDVNYKIQPFDTIKDYLNAINEHYQNFGKNNLKSYDEIIENVENIINLINKNINNINEECEHF